MIIDAIRKLAPDAVVGVNADDIDQIDWIDGNPLKITKKQIQEKLVEVQADYDALQYQRDRQYPQLGEQLDMLFHDMTAGKGTKDGEWYKAVAKVKSDNPKPTE